MEEDTGQAFGGDVPDFKVDLGAVFRVAHHGRMAILDGPEAVVGAGEGFPDKGGACVGEGRIEFEAAHEGAVDSKVNRVHSAPSDDKTGFEKVSIEVVGPGVVKQALCGQVTDGVGRFGSGPGATGSDIETTFFQGVYKRAFCGGVTGDTGF